MRVKANGERGKLRFEVQVQSLNGDTHDAMQDMHTRGLSEEAFADVANVLAAHLSGQQVIVVVKP